MVCSRWRWPHSCLASGRWVLPGRQVAVTALLAGVGALLVDIYLY